DRGRTFGAGGEEDDVPGLERAGALRKAEGRPTLEHEQPFLLRVLVVVRADRLTGRQLVDRGAELRGAELRAEPEHAGAEAVRIVVVVPELGVADVDTAHGRRGYPVIPLRGDAEQRRSGRSDPREQRTRFHDQAPLE